MDLLEFVIELDTSYYFGSEKSDSIHRRIRYLISLERDIPYLIYHNYAEIKIDSCNSLSLGWRFIIFS